MLKQSFEYIGISATQDFEGSDTYYFYNKKFGKPYKHIDRNYAKYIELAYRKYKTDIILKSL